MATRKQRQQVKRKERQYLIIERRYAKQIGRMYRQWLNDWLPRIMLKFKQKSMRFDALWDELAPLFMSMSDDWAARVISFEEVINETAADVAEVSQIDFTEKSLKLVSINLEPKVFNIIKSFAEENVKLIKDIGTETADDIHRVVVEAIEFGLTPDELTDKIAATSTDKFSSEADPEGYRVRLIARDQVGKLQGKIHMQRMEDAGFERYEWMTVGDNRVRPSHKALNGKIRKWTETPKPGQEIQCRCQPVVVLEDIL